MENQLDAIDEKHIYNKDFEVLEEKYTDEETETDSEERDEW